MLMAAYLEARILPCERGLVQTGDHNKDFLMHILFCVLASQVREIVNKAQRPTMRLQEFLGMSSYRDARMHPIKTISAL